jgi:hypothetical protein
MSEPLFLGIDLSTQQLKALLIDEKAIVVHNVAVGFDRDLPQYGTKNGATHGPEDNQVTSPVAMWVEAIDLILQRMKDAGVDFRRIRAVSGAGQVRNTDAYLIYVIVDSGSCATATWLSLLVEHGRRCARFTEPLKDVTLAT